MTGTERLRTLAGSWDAYGLGGALGDVARQIERERACDADIIENVRLIVGGVIDEMERHILGHEGMDDSPVARWARELREALKSDTSNGSDGEKPSCATTPDAADVTSDAQKVTRGDAEAIAWVRENGGLGAVKRHWDGYVPASWLEKAKSSYQRKRDNLKAHVWELERKCGERRERIRELEHERDELRTRVMPEGMEWLVEAWPRFEDDAPARFGEEAIGFACKPPFVIDHVTLFDGGEATVCAEADLDSGKVENFFRVHPGERVKRPAKVLDADGAEIQVGGTVWDVYTGERMIVERLKGTCGGYQTCLVTLESGEQITCDGPRLTHRAPVLAADGKPLREGEKVYMLHGELCDVFPCLGYHGGEELEVFSLHADHVEGGVGCRDTRRPRGTCYPQPSQLTHERPDSWERLEEDAVKSVCDYFEANNCYECGNAEGGCCKNMARDIVRRAKALSEGGER